MTQLELSKLLKSTGYQVAYRSFDVKSKPKLPFLIYFRTSNDNISADDGVYFKRQNMQIELYTDKKDVKAEEKLENIFDAAGIIYDVDEDYIQEEKMNMVIYNIQI